MTVEKVGFGRKSVLVGIRLDVHAKELLDWALVKVADPGDNVVAIHVCRSSEWISKEKTLLNGYLEDYEGLCSEKQVALSVEVLRENSIRRGLVREAKNHGVSAVIVGVTKHSALGGWTSIAKYCAKRLSPSIEVMAVHNGKVIFSRSSKFSFEGHSLDPKPSFHMSDSLSLKDGHSEYGESDASELSRLSFDARDSNLSLKDGIIPVRRQRRSSLSSISLPAGDFMKQRPGWPLLHTASSINQLAIEARQMSVVQWVMALPRRSSDISESNSPTCSDDSLEGDNRIAAELTVLEKLSELPKELENILLTNPLGCKVFSYDCLEISTCGFSSGNLIAKGRCNSVYKGILPEGKPVAVKKLASSREARKDFIREVDIMTTLNHKGTAPLLGICVERNSLISVYEFMARGSLEENLQAANTKDNPILPWEARFEIAVGVSEALNYLHNECPRPIIHRDVKSSNILLTDDLKPQLCDFGLAIWGPSTASFLMDRDVVGTFGYLAPEYFMYGKVSDKMDVYAFGVVLLELLSGRKPIGLETEKGQESLVIWAKPRLESRDYKSVLDPNLDREVDEVQMQRMALAASLCLTQAARLRPKMSQCSIRWRSNSPEFYLELGVSTETVSLEIRVRLCTSYPPQTLLSGGIYWVLNILKGNECEIAAKPDHGCFDDEENEGDLDDEVYPDSCTESHLSLALLDVNEYPATFSSIDPSSPLRPKLLEEKML